MVGGTICAQENKEIDQKMVSKVLKHGLNTKLSFKISH